MSDSNKRVPSYTPDQIRAIRENELEIGLEAMAAMLGYTYSTVQRYETEPGRVTPAFIRDFESLRKKIARERAAGGGPPRMKRMRRSKESSESPASPVVPPPTPPPDTQKDADNTGVEVPPASPASSTVCLTHLHLHLWVPIGYPSPALPSDPVPAIPPDSTAVFMSWPPVPSPRRLMAVFWRRVHVGRRLLPAGKTVPLAVLVSTPRPVIPHPVAMLRRQVSGQRLMLPANASGPASPLLVPANRARRLRWDARTEARVIAVGLAALIISGTGVLLWTHWQSQRTLEAKLDTLAVRAPPQRSAQSESPTSLPASTDAGSTSEPTPDAPDGGIAWEMASIERVPHAPRERPPSEPIPEHPDEDQVLPPCLVRPKGFEVEISGACYLKNGTAPCQPSAYEHEGSCYVPVMKKKKKKGTPPYSETKSGTTRTQDAPSLKKH